MHDPAFNLQKTGILQSRTAAGFTEQGVIADGTQMFDFGGLISGSDSPSSIFFASYDVAEGRNALVHWGNVNSSGYYATEWSTTPAGQMNPSGTFMFDTASNYGYVTSAQHATGRLHFLMSSEQSGSDIRLRYASWSSGLGWVTGNALRAGATNVAFNTKGDVLTLLKKRNNAGAVSGTLYRLAMWIGTTANVQDSTVQDLFTSGGSLVDPATAVATLGDANRVFDCYGNAATWDSGVFPKGSFAKSGNAFLNA